MPETLIRNGLADAPPDLDLLEFAIAWRVNPAELRSQWEIRDMHWLRLVEEARRLAAPEIAKRIQQK